MVIDLQCDHCASAPISNQGFGGLSQMKCVKYIWNTNWEHLLQSGWSWCLSVANCFLITCEPAIWFLILIRDHFRMRGNSSVLMDGLWLSSRTSVQAAWWVDGGGGGKQTRKSVIFFIYLCFLKSCKFKNYQNKMKNEKWPIALWWFSISCQNRQTVVVFHLLFEISEHCKTFNLYSPKWNCVSSLF